MATKTKKAVAKEKSSVIAFRVNPSIKAAVEKYCEELGLSSYKIGDAAKDALVAMLKMRGLL